MEKDFVTDGWNSQYFDWCFNCFREGLKQDFVDVEDNTGVLTDLLNDISFIRERYDTKTPLFSRDTKAQFKFTIPASWMVTNQYGEPIYKELLEPGFKALIENHISCLINVRHYINTKYTNNYVIYFDLKENE